MVSKALLLYIFFFSSLLTFIHSLRILLFRILLFRILRRLFSLFGRKRKAIFATLKWYRNQQMYHIVTINIHTKTYVLLPSTVDVILKVFFGCIIHLCMRYALDFGTCFYFVCENVTFFCCCFCSSVFFSLLLLLSLTKYNREQSALRFFFSSSSAFPLCMAFWEILDELRIVDVLSF